MKQLKDFKSGARQNPLMTGIAAGLSETDMENLAATGLLESMIPELSSLRNVSVEDAGKNALQFSFCVWRNLDKLTSSPDILFKNYGKQIGDFLSANNYRPLMRLSALFQGLDDSSRTGPSYPKKQPETIPLKVMKRMRASNADATGMDRILFFHKYVLEKQTDITDKSTGFDYSLTTKSCESNVHFPVPCMV